MASGKWKSALEASRAYRITGNNTVYSWMDKYGYGHLRNWGTTWMRGFRSRPPQAESGVTATEIFAPFGFVF